MVISQRAIIALCDDLRRWRERIQIAVANGSLDRNGLAKEVDSDGDNGRESDRILARLRMVDNAGPLADAILRQLTEGWGWVSMNSTSPENGLALCREFAAGVDRRVGDALEAVEQLRTDTLPSGDAAGGGQGEANGEPPKPAGRQAETRAGGNDAGIVEKTPGKAGEASKPVEPSVNERKAQRCQVLAYYASRYAELKLERKLSAQDAYDYWNEYGFDPADKDTENAAELAGYELPDSFRTYQSQLSHGRKAFDDPRYENRKGRQGRSIVRGDEID